MSDFVILGTDTDAGKTTFAVLWLTAFPREFAYWKPVETGESDTKKVRRLAPAALVLDPGLHFTQPVAAPLAASNEGRSVPPAAALAAMKPPVPEGRWLMIETFGGPFSPLNDHELQIALIRRLALPTLLVSSSALGAIGRTLKCLYALKQDGVVPFAVVLLGQRDDYAAKQITRYGLTSVFWLAPPSAWEPEAIRRAAEQHRETLEKIRASWQRVIQQAPPTASAVGSTVSPSGTAMSPGSTTMSPGGAVVSPGGAVVSPGGAGVVSQGREPLGEGIPPTLPSPGGAKESPSAPPELSPTAPPMPADPRDSADTVTRLLAADARHIWHPYTSLRDPDPPLVAVSARDEFLYLADGRPIIDGISSWWTILHGHRHPVLMEALADAARDFDHVLFAGVTHTHAIRLAELLLSTAPWPDGRVFYSDNGSTAVEVALKMAYQYWCHRGESRRTLFVGFEHGYHGDTFGAMAASRDPLFFGRFEPLLFRAEIVPVDPDRLDDTLTRHKGEVAAVILEPLLQAAGGMRLHTPETLAALFEVTRRHDVLFIADEVMTGGGRLGPLWAHSLAGIAPDLICAAKTLTGGVLPLAATLVAPPIVAAFDSADRTRTFFHGHSFTAHPLACAVAAANWQILTTAPPAAPQRLEAFWNEALPPLAGHPGVRDVRIRGTMAAVELDAPGGYLADIARALRRRCLEHGVMLRPLGNVLYALPPFCTSQASLERIAAAMIDAVKTI
jgi:adenosylmethionine-8-amino-7-oxononanoate aminotransferase